MRNIQLDEAQAGIKISGTNINNLRYAEDTTFTARSKDKRKGLLKKVKEESEKAGLKFIIQKEKIMASCPIIFMRNRWGNNGNMTDFIFLGSKIIADVDCRHKIKRCSLEEKR